MKKIVLSLLIAIVAVSLVLSVSAADTSGITDVLSSFDAGQIADAVSGIDGYQIKYSADGGTFRSL